VRRRGSVNHLAWARRYLVAKLHALQPAPFAYFLREIEAGAYVSVTLEEYAALPAEFIRGIGGG
jgi:hypothetical protein